MPLPFLSIATEGFKHRVRWIRKMHA